VNVRKQPLIDLPALIGARAKSLFLSRQMHCSEAVLVTLNRGLVGSLQEHQALALAAPFSEGVGKSGCMCGAAAGALLAIGLFIGASKPAPQRAAVKKAAGDFMERFKGRFGSACCRVLAKRGRSNSSAHFAHCAELTARAAASAAELIFVHRPELMQRVDLCFLDARDSSMVGFIKNARHCASCRT